MSAAKPSRPVLSRWASDLGVPLSTNPEKQCASGAIYCQLFNLVRPGLLNMNKVNSGPNENTVKVEQNYKLLAAALDKAGSTQEIDIPGLTKGAPMASLELLHRLYAMSGAVSSAATPRGLKDIDPNALGSESGQRAGGKRKAAVPLSAGDAGGVKRVSKAESCVSVASTAAESTASTAAAPSEPTRVEVVLKRQLEEARAELSRSRQAQLGLEEEVAFYIKKLESIEDACQACPTSSLSVTVLGLLHADEAEMAAAVPVA
jgi:RP/EB family microtubule-associated protein